MAMAMAMEFEVLDHPKLCFGEGPRWHDGSLHVVDMYGDEAVYKVESEGLGEVTEVVKVPGQPSGTGWLPDGRMIVVSMKTRKVLAFDGRTLSTHADLGDLAAGEANDMVVDGTGRAYVGNFGFDLFSLGSLLQKVKYYAFLALFAITSRPFTSLVPGTADLVCLSPDGKARKVAAGLLFPNGMVITPDGGTLIVAETLGARLTAFDILEADGGLASRRVWAKLPWGEPPRILLSSPLLSPLPAVASF